MFKYAIGVGLMTGAIFIGALHFTASAITVKQPLTSVPTSQSSAQMLQPTITTNELQPANAQLQGNNGDAAKLQPTVAGTSLQ